MPFLYNAWGWTYSFCCTIFSGGEFPSPAIMTGTTCHQEGIEAPWRQVCFLLAAQLIEQTAFAAFGSITLFRFQKPCLAEIPEGAAHGGLGKLQFFGNGRDRRPALPILIGSVRKVNIDG